MDDDVTAYVEAIRPEHRPLFDRVHRLIVDAYPEVDVVTIALRPAEADGIADDEILALVRSVVER